MLKNDFMSGHAHASAAKIQEYLAGIEYPVSKQQLVEYADKQGAPLNVRTVLDRLPEDDYDSPATVSRAVGAVE